MNTANPHQRIIDGLHELAAFLAEHPDVPISDVRVNYYVRARDDNAGRARLSAIADQLGTEVTSTLGSPVKPDTTHFQARRMFGPVEYDASYIRRQAVAEWDALMSYDGAIRTTTTPQ